MATVNTETPAVLRFTQVATVDGRIQFFVESAACFTLQLAYHPGGPWHDATDGIEGQPVSIAIPPDGSPRYYRAIPRDCPQPEAQ